MKADYYELLGVTNSADDSELKKGFRKRALKYHPDKNSSDDAAILFNEIRVAYETLTDPQERAWYDSHKYQVLAEAEDISGDDADTDNSTVYYSGTTVQDIEKYFNDGMYTKFNDSASGFYQIINVLVTRISSEEVSSGKKQGLPGFQSFKDDTTMSNACDASELMYPRFGNSRSEYGNDVRLFYKAWTNFQSIKTFTWFDEYRYSTAPDRRTRRLMEKENKKRRQQARKEYNEIIRKWISYIKHRDPRVTPIIQRKYEKDRVKKQQKDLKRQAQKERQQRKEEDSEYVEQDWQTIDADELADIEQQLDKLYNEEDMLNGEKVDEEDFNRDIYECVVCDKVFKSEEQLKDHERSKKHIKKLRRLKWEMRQEGVELGIDDKGFLDEETEEELFDDALEEMVEEELDDEESVVDESALKDHSAVDEGNKTIKEPANISDSLEAAVDENLDDLDNSSLSRLQLSGDEASSAASESKTRGSNRSKDMKLQELSAILNGTTLESDSDDDWSTGNKKSRKSKRKGRSKPSSGSNSHAPPSAADGCESSWVCAVCGKSFFSRNKLFQHVNDTGHVAPPSKVKKGKKKNRN
ncbi:hypothetical protein FOA43_003134 [Brettanomyces nanus]|uniref:Uncharacterized protein n=1 Tax=Eeniella nana TaxID=13502 RepID=A0A875S4D9_EENNA|nr:uncharacterized protein FOA43_003134 [Brettanomyces nanus]QPG75773.1 hypothetical protein FOA43_003134 [Brettanomyces nanus]